MRKMLTLLLSALLLMPRASAAETPKYLALTFEDVPPGCGEKLLEGLALRRAKATFFFSLRQLEDFPAIAAKTLAEGHEVGFRAFEPGELAALSRRDMAEELAEARTLLPENTHQRFLRLGMNTAPPQVCQVARARGLALLGWSGDLRNREAGDYSAAGQTPLSRIGDGDILVLSADTGPDVNGVLTTVDLLQKRGFRLVTVSELARLRGRRITAGAYYRSFPPGEP